MGHDAAAAIGQGLNRQPPQPPAPLGLAVKAEQSEGQGQPSAAAAGSIVSIRLVRVSISMLARAARAASSAPSPRPSAARCSGSSGQPNRSMARGWASRVPLSTSQSASPSSAPLASASRQPLRGEPPGGAPGCRSGRWGWAPPGPGPGPAGHGRGRPCPGGPGTKHRAAGDRPRLAPGSHWSAVPPPAPARARSSPRQQRGHQFRFGALQQVEQGCSVVEAPSGVLAGTTGGGPASGTPTRLPQVDRAVPATTPQPGGQGTPGHPGADHRQ